MVILSLLLAHSERCMYVVKHYMYVLNNSSSTSFLELPRFFFFAGGTTNNNIMPISYTFRRPKTPTGPPPTDAAVNAFVEFFDATDIESAREAFERSCAEVDLTPYGSINDFYRKYKIALKEHVPYRYRDIWKILDKKATQKPYQGAVAEGQNVLVIGAGPCGLRTAIETQLLGANTVIIERRNAFTRNNVLKLWKFLIEDLKSLGAKKLYGMFCAGNINHVGIKTLQLILAKVVLFLGVRIVAPSKLGPNHLLL